MKVITLRHRDKSLPPRWGLKSLHIYRGFAALHPRLDANGPFGARKLVGIYLGVKVSTCAPGATIRTQKVAGMSIPQNSRMNHFLYLYT